MRIRFGPFLDLDQRRLFASAQEVKLQPKAFELLRALVEARPRALSKDEILGAVWPDVYITENSLATVIRDLRQALGDQAQEPQYIRTIYGYGYAFAAGASVVPDDAAGSPFSGWRLIHDHREIRLRQGLNVLGRTGHDVVVIDSPTVSRHHAAIHVDGDHATVEDLGSKNGTYLGAVAVTGAMPLPSAGSLRVGSVVMSVRFAASDPTTETGTVS